MMIPPNLASLFEGLPLLEDTDGDGYPDRVATRILVHPNLEDPFVWAGLLNLTARLAFETVALKLPILKKQARPGPGENSLFVYPPGYAPPGIKDQALPPAWAHRDSGIVSLRGASGKAMMEALHGLALGERHGNLRPRNKKARPRPSGVRTQTLDLLDLSCLYDTPLLRPRTKELKALLSIPRHPLSSLVGSALSDLVARMALEATEITLPLVFVGAPRGRGIVLRVEERGAEGHEIRLSGPQTVLFRGDPLSLSRAIRNWASWAFAAGGEGSEAVDFFRDRAEAFGRLLAGEGYWGKWSRILLRREATTSTPMPPAQGGQYAMVRKGCRALALPPPPKSKGPKTLRRTVRWRSETEEVLDRVKQVPHGQGELEGLAFLSKPESRRRKIKARLEKILKAKGYKPKVRVLNAYKPGLSWLLEEVLPALKKIGPVAALEVAYQPFQENHALEMKSRWLQEIFPGPDILGLALSIPFRKIKLRCHAGLKAVYQVKALDDEGEVLFKARLSPPFARIPYLHHEPELGFVHPAAGGILLKGKGRILLEEPIPTDRDRFWKIFQTQWLPFLENAMAERSKKEDPEGQRAFWEDISIQVSMEETDFVLPLGEEGIRPLEALHEDLYFVLLRFFASFARRHGIDSSLHLGRILPQVKQLAGPGSPFARLAARPLSWPRAPGKASRHTGKLPAPSALSMAGKKWQMAIAAPHRGAQADRFITLARAWGYEVIREKNSTFLLELEAPSIKRKPKTRNPIREPRRDRLLKAREVTDWIRRLGRCQNLGAWRASHSLQGRPIYALEAFCAGRASLSSVAKLRLLKPTFFFNARHHANEISGTNAALFMAWQLASTPKGRELLRDVNLIWIPMENVDGVATFEELLPTGRGHMLHAARYNALGAEFYEAYFQTPPPFPEAQAKAGLWRRWLPEIMVDHHGVPSHEWNQPFSGYAPFGFREFWIPRNFVYACMPFVNEPRHPLHKAARSLRALLEKAMAEEPEILRENLEIASRYRRYACGPEPETFPDSKGEPMLVVPPLGRTYNTNFAVRFPRVTPSEIVLEVPDEVAKGRRLELCVRAHVKSEEALLRAFRRTRGGIEGFPNKKTGLLRLMWVPGRPV